MHGCRGSDLSYTIMYNVAEQGLVKNMGQWGDSGLHCDNGAIQETVMIVRSLVHNETKKEDSENTLKTIHVPGRHV